MADPTPGKGKKDTAIPMQAQGPAASVANILTQLAQFLRTAAPTDLAPKQLFANAKGELDGWGEQFAAQEWDQLAQSVESFRQLMSTVGGRTTDMKLMGQLDDLLVALRNSARAAAEAASQSG